MKTSSHEAYQVLDDGERAGSMIRSIDRPANRPCIKSSNAEVLFKVDNWEELLMGDCIGVIVEQSVHVRALVLKIPIAYVLESTACCFNCIIFLVYSIAIQEGRTTQWSETIRNCEGEEQSKLTKTWVTHFVFRSYFPPHQEILLWYRPNWFDGSSREKEGVQNENFCQYVQCNTWTSDCNWYSEGWNVL